MESALGRLSVDEAVPKFSFSFQSGKSPRETRSEVSLRRTRGWQVRPEYFNASDRSLCCFRGAPEIPGAPSFPVSLQNIIRRLPPTLRHHAHEHLLHEDAETLQQLRTSECKTRLNTENMLSCLVSCLCWSRVLRPRTTFAAYETCNKEFMAEQGTQYVRQDEYGRRSFAKKD